MTRFLVDECCSERIVAALRLAGHDVDRVAIGSGLPDREVAALATSGGRVLVTMDKDFGQIAREALLPWGVALVRSRPSQLRSAIDRLLDAVAVGSPSLDGSMLVVEPGSTRRQRLPSAR